MSAGCSVWLGTAVVYCRGWSPCRAWLLVVTPAPLLYVIGWREKLYDSLYDSLVTAYLEGELDLLRHLDLEGWSVGAARPGQEGD